MGRACCAAAVQVLRGCCALSSIKATPQNSLRVQTLRHQTGPLLCPTAGRACLHSTQALSCGAKGVFGSSCLLSWALYEQGW